MHSRHPPATTNGPFRCGITAAIAVQCNVNVAVGPFPATGDAACGQYVGGGPSHGHWQHAQKW